MRSKRLMKVLLGSRWAVAEDIRSSSASKQDEVVILDDWMNMNTNTKEAPMFDAGWFKNTARLPSVLKKSGKEESSSSSSSSREVPGDDGPDRQRLQYWRYRTPSCYPSFMTGRFVYDQDSFVVPCTRQTKWGHFGTEYWPTGVVLEPIMSHTECLRRVCIRLDSPDITPHDMIVSSLDHLIDEVRAAFLAGVPYYSPVRV